MKTEKSDKTLKHVPNRPVVFSKTLPLPKRRKKRKINKRFSKRETHENEFPVEEKCVSKQ